MRNVIETYKALRRRNKGKMVAANAVLHPDVALEEKLKSAEINPHSRKIESRVGLEYYGPDFQRYAKAWNVWVDANIRRVVADDLWTTEKEIAAARNDSGVSPLIVKRDAAQELIDEGNLSKSELKSAKRDRRRASEKLGRLGVNTRDLEKGAKELEEKLFKYDCTFVLKAPGIGEDYNRVIALHALEQRLDFDKVSRLFMERAQHSSPKTIEDVVHVLAKLNTLYGLIGSQYYGKEAYKPSDLKDVIQGQLEAYGESIKFASTTRPTPRRLR